MAENPQKMEIWKLDFFTPVKGQFNSCHLYPRGFLMIFFYLFLMMIFSPPAWLVVEPTHLKNMLVKLDPSSPSRGENIKN